MCEEGSGLGLHLAERERGGGECWGKLLLAAAGSHFYFDSPVFLVDVPPSRSLECREQCMQREQWVRAAFR